MGSNQKLRKAKRELELLKEKQKTRENGSIIWRRLQREIEEKERELRGDK